MSEQTVPGAPKLTASETVTGVRLTPPPPAGRASSVPPAPAKTSSVQLRAPSLPPPIPEAARTGSFRPSAPPVPQEAFRDAVTRSSRIPPPPPPQPRRTDDSLHALAKAHDELKAARFELTELRDAVSRRDARIAELTRTLAARTLELHDAAGKLEALQRETGCDLKRIRGIGPAYERLLHAAGVTTFEAIARWTEADVQRIAALLNTPAARIARAGWIEQARELA